jgi:hypothetical protein
MSARWSGSKAAAGVGLVQRLQQRARVDEVARVGEAAHARERGPCEGARLLRCRDAQGSKHAVVERVAPASGSGRPASRACALARAAEVGQRLLAEVPDRHLLRVAPVAQQRLGEVVQPARLAHAQPQVEVFGMGAPRR